MIAECLPAAFRDLYSGDAEPRCDREPNFVEMYDVLGNREAQDQIRAGNPAVKHCHLLIEESASYCAACPNNPHLPTHPKHQAIDNFAVMASAVARAMVLHDRMEAGERFEFAAMRPEDVSCLRSAISAVRQQQAEIQGRIIAAQVAEIVARLFAAK